MLDSDTGIYRLNAYDGNHLFPDGMLSDMVWDEFNDNALQNLVVIPTHRLTLFVRNTIEDLLEGAAKHVSHEYNELDDAERVLAMIPEMLTVLHKLSKLSYEGTDYVFITNKLPVNKRTSL